MKAEQISVQKHLVLRNSAVFLTRLAELLGEGYPFPDALNLLLPHHTKEYKTVFTEIDADFRKGYGVSEILSRFGFPSGALLPIAIAENNGNLIEALKGMAKRMRKLDEAKRKLRNLLSYPIVLFVFVTLLLVIFRNFFLPNMEALLASRQGDEKGLFSVLPLIVSKIPDLTLALGFVITIVIFCCGFVYKRLTPAKKIRFFANIPVVRNLFFMWKTQVFAGEMGNLLESGTSMQNSLDVLIGQRLDPVLGEIARNIKEYVKYGESLHEAINLTDGLTKEFSSFAEHGAISGHLGRELLIYSAHLEETIDLKLSKGLALLQPILFSIIAICILAAYMAILLPVYGMLDKI